MSLSLETMSIVPMNLKTVYDYAERARTLDGAFSAKSSVVEGEKVLLFDDL